MRDPVSQPASHLDALMAAPARHDFYAACRIMECARPDLPRIGEAWLPREEALRFGQYVSLAFRPAMIAGIVSQGSAAGSTPAPRLLVNFFGLTGPNGPLPLHITEYLRDRLRNAKDPTMARFLDVFHHRLLSLFYRAWAAAQPAVSQDRPEQDRFAAYVAAIAGLGLPALSERDAVPARARLFYAGRMAGRRNAAGLAAILSDDLGVPVRVREFVGQWSPLAEDGLCRLRNGPQAARLGRDTVIGRRLWQCQDKFRIEAGPLDGVQLAALLPGQPRARRLRDWVRQYAGPVLDWDLRLIVKKEDRPRLRLGKTARLGWTSWLGSKSPAVDDGQLCIASTRLAARPHKTNHHPQ